MKIKLLNAFIIAACLFLVVRVIDITNQPTSGLTSSLSKMLSSSTIAQEVKGEDVKAQEKKKQEAEKAKGETKPAEAKHDTKKPEAGSEKVTEKGAPKVKNTKETAEGGTIEESDVAPVSYDQQKKFSPTEVDILQRLSERREKLDKWEGDLQIKENVLKITEQRLDKKLDELRTLKKEVEKSLDEYNKKEDEKTKSLVKIYENMKPKAAADILSKMDMDSLLPIMSKMKEKSAAEILSKMDPATAETITTRLSKLGRLKGLNR